MEFPWHTLLHACVEEAGRELDTAGVPYRLVRLPPAENRHAELAGEDSVLWIEEDTDAANLVLFCGRRQCRHASVRYFEADRCHEPGEEG